MSVHVRRKVLRWGNGFGIRLTKSEAAALGIQAGDEVEADLERPGDDVHADLERMAVFRFGDAGGIDHDEAIGDELAEEGQRWDNGSP